MGQQVSVSSLLKMGLACQKISGPGIMNVEIPPLVYIGMLPSRCACVRNCIAKYRLYTTIE